MKKLIIIKTDFPAIHNWPKCDIDAVMFLTYPHRHIFFVVMKFDVTHNDREIEFIKKKMEVDKFINENYREKNLGAMSCESIAEMLMMEFNASFVSVFEDNENGAEIYA